MLIFEGVIIKPTTPSVWCIELLEFQLQPNISIFLFEEVIPQLLTKEILTSVRVGAAWMGWPWVVEFLEEKLRKKTDSSVIVNQSSLFYIYKEENADTFQEICFLPRCRLEINSTLIIYPYEQPSGEVKVQGLGSVLKTGEDGWIDQDELYSSWICWNMSFFKDVFTIKMHHHPSGILLFWSMSNLYKPCSLMTWSWLPPRRLDCE